MAAAKPLISSVTGAKQYFGWLLARREYAEIDLRRKALHKGFVPADIDEALAFVQQHGFQNNERYAGSVARQAASRKGNRAIEQALRAKKLPADLIAAQIAALPCEVQRAGEFLERQNHSDWNAQQKQKAWSRLLSRGFSSDAIKAAIKCLEQQLALK